MVIAYDKNKNRIHVDDADLKATYYCPSCGGELCIKRGAIKAHHFAHLSISNCDGWHYDMSEWHSLWQSQFPINNQEIIFEKDEKKHRADVFIKNTVIEFQHSSIKYDEFKERNDFYTSLGYKVVWIFDATSAYLNSDIEELFDNNYSWRNSIVNLKGYDNKMVDVYLQEFNNIWHSTPNYKELSLTNGELLGCGAYLHHIDETQSVSPDAFLSTDKNNLYDYELIDNYMPVKFLHDGSFDKDLSIAKKQRYVKAKKDYNSDNDIIPSEVFTIKEAFENQKGTQVIRLRNINTGWKVQITKYNYDMMLRYNKCYGKVQAPEIRNNYFSKKESDIFAFNKREWIIIWRYCL